MKFRRYLYGSMSALSLLGFIGIFTDEKSFLVFFAFILDFEYFFIKSDEMLEEYMNKSASRAFYCGMIITAITVLIAFLVQNQTGNESLLRGITYGWSSSIFVYALSTAFYGLKEKWCTRND